MHRLRGSPPSPAPPAPSPAPSARARCRRWILHPSRPRPFVATAPRRRPSRDPCRGPRWVCRRACSWPPRRSCGQAPPRTGLRSWRACPCRVGSGRAPPPSSASPPSLAPRAFWLAAASTTARSAGRERIGRISPSRRSHERWPNPRAPSRARPFAPSTSTEAPPRRC